MNKRIVLLLSAFVSAFLIGGAAIVVSGASAAGNPPAVNAQPALVSQPVAQPAQPDAARISGDAAAQAALSASPGAQLTSAPELVDYQGVVAYEVRLDAGLVYVDAGTGSVIFNGAVPQQAGPQQVERGWSRDGDDDDDHEEFEHDEHEHEHDDY
jgi:hypothetical protein